MNKVARANCERGLSTVELTMALPLVIFGMLFLIGMGHALISKQHTLVGGEFAAQYHRVRESAPSAAVAGQAASAPAEAETFRLSGGGSDTLSYTANATPRKGLIAQLYHLNAAQSQYQIPNVTNACVPHCKPFSAFVNILSPETIAGLLFSALSGKSGGFSGDDLLSAVTEKGKKPGRQIPAGAKPIGPLKASSAGIPGAVGIAPAAAGGGGGKPPRRPPARAAGSGDDGDPSGNGGNGQNNSGGGGRTNRTSHAEDRKRQADEGDTHRQVGDANRVRQKGRRFLDNKTGNTIYVDGDRVVVVDPQGVERSRFRNPRANTQQRIRDGRWIPQDR